MNHKCIPMDSTFLWKIAHHRLGLLRKERWNTKCEHLQKLLFERKLNKRQFGGKSSGAASSTQTVLQWWCTATIRRRRTEATSA
jgi:hypothetical protein